MLDYGTTSNGATEVKNIFKKTNYFNNPKPLELLKFLLQFKDKKRLLSSIFLLVREQQLKRF